MQSAQTTDIAIIGAGPAGSVVAALLRRNGWRVTVIERSVFPRFTIGESLLPQCMESLAEADMLGAVEAAGFQIKRGVTFAEGARSGTFSFAEQYTEGWDWTWHVPRADFDDILAREAEKRGADMRFGEQVEEVDLATPGSPRLSIRRADSTRYRLEARFLCDASGFARVLPSMLGLDAPTDAPPRAALFSHVRDRIDAADYRRDDIVLSIHPDHPDVWYWLIAFSNGRASVGVVGNPDVVQGAGDPTERLRALTAEEPHVARLLANADYDTPARSIKSYASSSTALHGQDYALLGNAGGFIDPVFSSGVTVAMKSSVLAAQLIDQQLRGQTADWDNDFEKPLQEGLAVFRSFVEAWYDSTLKHVFFRPDPDPEIRSMLGSILGGYVWDKRNPYVAKPKRRLRALCEVCAP